MLTEDPLGRAGLDAVALKRMETAVSQAQDFGVDTVVVDYEGREHLPDAGVLGTDAE